MILDHVNYARAQGHPFVYLGYWIEGSRKMRYKNRFQPQERLTLEGLGAARMPEAPEDRSSFEPGRPAS